MPKEKPKNQSSEKRQQKEIDPKDIQGLKFFKVLRPFLKRLHDVGTERDRAQNRQLHMDQYCTMVLLWLYSPVVDSLRGLQQASQLKKVQKRFNLPQSSLGSLSESVRVFDPEPLKQIAAELYVSVGTQHVARSERFRLQRYCTLTRFWCDGYGGSWSEGRQVAAAIEVSQITNIHRGRDGHYWPPPAQIRTCRTTAYGSYLG